MNVDYTRLESEMREELKEWKMVPTELLEQIDRKALAGLCQMSHGGTREFLKDIRMLITTTPTPPAPEPFGYLWRDARQEWEFSKNKPEFPDQVMPIYSAPEPII